MPVNLLGLFNRAFISSGELDRTQHVPDLGMIVYHPRYERWLKRAGVDSAEAAYSLAGEVVCGHPDRHVVLVEWTTATSRRTAFLKREHLVGLRARVRNRLAGFGPVSRCEREATTLARLEAAGLAAPQWLAYGEDRLGRGFLLVDEVSGSVNLLKLLNDYPLSPHDRRRVAETIGRTLAEFHDAGFATPELAAKHLLVNPDHLAVTLLDWQSSPRPRPVSHAERTRALANLLASLPSGLASRTERLRVVTAYLRHSRPGFVPGVRDWLLAISARARHRGDKSSIRDQHECRRGGEQRLCWLAGEEACVIPRLVSIWPVPAAAAPFYSEPELPALGTEEGQQSISFADGTRAVLNRFRSFSPLGRLLAAIRERPWRSPAAVQARLLFHLARHGVDAPTLLGFGQRMLPGARAESFIVSQPDPESASLFDRLDGMTDNSHERRVIFSEVGRLLRRLHDIGCRLNRLPPGETVFTVTNTRPLAVLVANPGAVRLTRGVSQRRRIADFVWLCQRIVPGFARTDYARLARGYAGHGPAGRVLRRRLLARVA